MTGGICGIGLFTCLPRNPFVSNAPFLYPLKTSENLTISCFQGVEKGCIGKEWVKKTFQDIPDAGCKFSVYETIRRHLGRLKNQIKNKKIKNKNNVKIDKLTITSYLKNMKCMKRAEHASACQKPPANNQLFETNRNDFPSEITSAESFISIVAVKKIPSQLLFHKKFLLIFFTIVILQISQATLLLLT